MGTRIFKSEAHQQLFDKQGFIVLPFINAEEVAHLNKRFDELHPNLGTGGFFSGSYSPDYDYKKAASDEIVKVFTRAYESLFVDYTPFGGAFLYKVPGPNSALAPHQDWTIVNETTDVALNCWVPLCDITADNGPIEIMPGSQCANRHVIRAPTLPFFFSGSDELVLAELEPMLVKAGTAVILNQSVIHYSPPNTSNAVRKAITAGIKSKGAQMRFHYKVPDKQELEVFEMDDDFLIRFSDFMNDIGQRPKMGRSVGTIPYSLKQLTGDALMVELARMKTGAGFALKTKASVPPASVPANPIRKFLQNLFR